MRGQTGKVKIYAEKCRLREACNALKSYWRAVSIDKRDSFCSL